MRNWAGNYEFQAANDYEPVSVDEIAERVRAATKVHAVGSRHSFSDVADAPGGTLLSLRKMNRVLAIDRQAKTVTIEAGITYGELGPVLHREGFALANLASLPHITVAGAIATATHGSGELNGSLSTGVAGLEMVLADSSTKTLRRGDADFNGAVVSLGGLGVVTQLTLDIVPTFDVSQHVYRSVPMAAVADAYDQLLKDTYSVSIFTTWQTDSFEQVWMKAVAGRPHFDVTSLGGIPAKERVHPIENVPGMPDFVGYDPASTTAQLGEPGPWFDRLPHFKLEHTPSAGEELQTEFFVPREHAAAAFKAVHALRDDLRPYIQVSEIRAVAADELWLSPFYERRSVGIHFTWRRDIAGVTALATKLEAALTPFNARPHWAKIFTTSLQRIAELYPRLDDFVRMRQAYDPDGKFLTPYLNRYVVGE